MAKDGIEEFLAQQQPTGENGNGSDTFADEATDPFSHQNIVARNSQYAEGVHISKLNTPNRIMVGLPLEQYVRVDARTDYQLFPVSFFIDKDKKRPGRQYHLLGNTAVEEIHALANSGSILGQALEHKIREGMLYFAVTRHGTQYIWPISMSGDTWTESQRLGAKEAMSHWISMVSQGAGGEKYEILPAEAPNWPDPKWPTEPFLELLRRGFGKELLINNLSHPYIQEFAGAK